MLIEKELLLYSAVTYKNKEVLLKQRRLLEGGTLNWGYILDEANYHRLNALLYYNLQSEGLMRFLPEKISSSLEKKNYAIAFSNLKLSRELKRLLGIFSEKRIESIVLKGPVLDEGIYPQKGLRPFADMDILIHREDLTQVEEILSREGYVIPEGILPERFYRQFHFEIPFINEAKGKIYLEIHWDLLPRWRLHSPDVFEVWKRREFLGGEKALYSLCPEDMIIYLCGHLDLHAYMNRYHYASANIRDYIFKRLSGNRLIWFSDLWAAIGFFTERINWGRLVERTKRWGLNSAVYANLAVMEKLFSSGAPQLKSNLAVYRKELETVSLAPISNRVKKGLVSFSEKLCFLSKRRSVLEAKIGFRRPFSRTDLIEYMFPDKISLEAKYRHAAGRKPLFYRFKYCLGCLCDGLRALLMLMRRR